MITRSKRKTEERTSSQGHRSCFINQAVSSACSCCTRRKEPLKLKYDKLQAMYEHLRDSHDILQNEVSHYRRFHEGIRCKLEGVSERFEEVITTFEDLTTKNFHDLQNSVNEMAEESSLAMAELSVGIQTELSRTDVLIHSFKSDFDKAVKELDEKIAVLFGLELDIRTLPLRINPLCGYTPHIPLRKNPLFRYTQDM